MQQPQTQTAFTDLLLKLFNEAVICENLTWLLKKVVNESLKDDDFRENLSSNLKLLLTDKNTKEGLSALLQEILRDHSVMEVTKAFVRDTLRSQMVKDQATELSKTIVEGVVNDPNIQKTAGEAMWSALGYTVTPRWLTKAQNGPIPPSVQIEVREPEYFRQASAFEQRNQN